MTIFTVRGRPSSDHCFSKSYCSHTLLTAAGARQKSCLKKTQRLRRLWKSLLAACLRTRRMMGFRQRSLWLGMFSVYG